MKSLTIAVGFDRQEQNVFEELKRFIRSTPGVSASVNIVPTFLSCDVKQMHIAILLLSPEFLDSGAVYNKLSSTRYEAIPVLGLSIRPHRFDLLKISDNIVYTPSHGHGYYFGDERSHKRFYSLMNSEDRKGFWREFQQSFGVFVAGVDLTEDLWD